MNEITRELYQEIEEEFFKLHKNKKLKNKKKLINELTSGLKTKSSNNVGIYHLYNGAIMDECLEIKYRNHVYILRFHAINKDYETGNYHLVPWVAQLISIGNEKLYKDETYDFKFYFNGVSPYTAPAYDKKNHKCINNMPYISFNKNIDKICDDIFIQMNMFTLNNNNNRSLLDEILSENTLNSNNTYDAKFYTEIGNKLCKAIKKVDQMEYKNAASKQVNAYYLSLGRQYYKYLVVGDKVLYSPFSYNEGEIAHKVYPK